MTKNRNIILDILRLSLAFMVVGLHAKFLADITLIGNHLLVNGLFRIAVPMFLLINGFYFYPIIVKNQQRKWFKRVLYLYIFWMLIYSYFWFNPAELNFIEILKVIVRNLFLGHFHLWYIVGMLGSALIIIYLKNLSLKVAIFSIVITFLLGVFIQYLSIYYVSNNDIVNTWLHRGWLHRNFLLLAFPFFFTGFLINKFDIHKKVLLKFSILLSLIGLTLLLTESYFNYSEQIRHIIGLSNLLSLIIICPTLFILFIKLNIKGTSKQLALYATGIYLIHPLFLSLNNNFLDLDKTILTFIVFIASLVSSYFLIKANKKLKFIL